MGSSGRALAEGRSGREYRTLTQLWLYSQNKTFSNSSEHKTESLKDTKVIIQSDRT